MTIKKPGIVLPPGSGIGIPTKEVKKVPKIKKISPFGSKILVETLNNDETMETSLYVSKTIKIDEAPQAYIVALGNTVSADCGLKAGLRVYWSGKGTAVADPETTPGRQRAMLEISNILAIVDEE